MAKPVARTILRTPAAEPAESADEGSGSASNTVEPDHGITVASLFCDDIRLEASGKLTLVGHYLSETCLIQPNGTLDRCAVYVHASWPWQFQPKAVSVRVDMPGRESSVFPVQLSPRLKSSQDDHSAPLFLVQSILQLRFPPLRAGDTISVYLRTDDTERPAGRLMIRRLPSATAASTPPADIPVTTATRH